MTADTTVDHADITSSITESHSAKKDSSPLATSVPPTQGKVPGSAEHQSLEEPDRPGPGVSDRDTVTVVTDTTTGASTVVTQPERATQPGGHVKRPLALRDPGGHVERPLALSGPARSELGTDLESPSSAISEDLPTTLSDHPGYQEERPPVDKKHIVPVSVIGGDNDSPELPQLPLRNTAKNVSVAMTSSGPDVRSTDRLPDIPPRSSPEKRDSITKRILVTMTSQNPVTTHPPTEESTTQPHPEPTREAVPRTRSTPRVIDTSPEGTSVTDSHHTGREGMLPKTRGISSQTVHDSATSAGIIIVPDKTPNIKIVAIVTPIVLGCVILLLVGVIIALLYRRNRRHRKQNIIKYKRYSQNGDLAVPLTAVSNDNYRSSRVSAHEDAVVYSQVDKTLRPPRPTYRYKTISQSSSTTDHNHSLWHTYPRQHNNNNTPDELETTLIDNSTYETSPSSPSPPKVPVRKSSSEQGSLKRTPGSPKKEISWPIPKGDSPVNGGLRTCNAPPIPPSPRHGPPAHRPVPPSPRSLPATPSTSRPMPPTPPSPSRHVGLPSLPPPPRGHRHEYDPVYVPSSDALAMNQRLDDAGYVTSRRMRMHALLGTHQPYEDVQLALTHTPHSEGGCVSSTSTSPSRSHRSAATSPSSPASMRTGRVSESDGADLASGDHSFDTLGTEGSSRPHFSLEDITNIVSESSGTAHGGNSTDGEVEYSVIPGDYSDTDIQNRESSRTSIDDSDCEKDGVYETVSF